MINIDNVEKFVNEALSQGEHFSLRKEGWIELITRLRQAEKDAARYRWLRVHHDQEDDTVSIFINDEQHGAGHLDAQIDEAMQCK